MVKIPTLRELLNVGAHFGHTRGRRHPKAKSFIFTTKNSINIINLELTQSLLKEALEYVKKLGSEGKTILFVGTKRQTKSLLTERCQKAGVPYVAERWIGGLLTNFEVIRKSVEMYIELEKQREESEFQNLNKVMQAKMEHKLLRLRTNFGGIKELTKLPDALFILDLASEKTAVREARKMDIPIIALVDTNADPTLAQYPIPSNDDAGKVLELMLNLILEAYEEGKELAEKIAVSKEEEDKKSVSKKGTKDE